MEKIEIKIVTAGPKLHSFLEIGVNDAFFRVFEEDQFHALFPLKKYFDQNLEVAKFAWIEKQKKEINNE